MSELTRESYKMVAQYQSVRELASRFTKMVASPHLVQLRSEVEKIHQERLAIPSTVMLESLLLPTLVASIRNEEGRPVSFRWVLPLTGSAGRTERMLCFDESREFTVDELVRLSPVMNSPMRRIVVRVIENQPHIVGIEDSALHRETSQLLRQLMSYPIDEIECSITGRGQLRLTWSYFSFDYDSERVHQKLSLMCSDLDAYFKRSAATPINFQETEQLLDAQESAKQSKARNEGATYMAFVRFWDRVLERVQQYGHGGTFLIASQPDAVAATPKYKLKVEGLSNIIKEHCKWGVCFADLRFREQLDEEEKRHFEAFLCEYLVFEKKLAHMIDLVAGLASVDGAVLMNQQFDVLGFGTRVAIDPKKAEGEIDFVDWTDAKFRRRKRRMSTLGMRHLSAAEFVASNDGSLAIVISQDGNLRMFSKDDVTNEVVCDESFAPYGTILQEEAINSIVKHK